MLCACLWWQNSLWRCRLEVYCNLDVLRFLMNKNLLRVGTMRLNYITFKNLLVLKPLFRNYVTEHLLRVPNVSAHSRILFRWCLRCTPLSIPLYCFEIVKWAPKVIHNFKYFDKLLGTRLYCHAYCLYYTGQQTNIFFSWVYELLVNSEPILSPKYDGVLSFWILANVFEHFGF